MPTEKVSRLCTSAKHLEGRGCVLFHVVKGAQRAARVDDRKAASECGGREEAKVRDPQTRSSGIGIVLEGAQRRLVACNRRSKPKRQLISHMIMLEKEGGKLYPKFVFFTIAASSAMRSWQARRRLACSPLTPLCVISTGVAASRLDKYCQRRTNEDRVQNERLREIPIELEGALMLGWQHRWRGKVQPKAPHVSAGVVMGHKRKRVCYEFLLGGILLPVKANVRGVPSRV